MAKYLVVVESPTKVKALKKYLGKDYEVLASKGHVKDLPDRSLGVDLDKDFEPQYVTIPGKEKILKEITTAAKNAESVFLAPDPDREGEAIAWHIASELKKPDQLIKRVLIQEITKKGVQDAISHPAVLDINKYESQQARRILDRLVGYQISPILWKKVKRGLSAGRVQSVAVRLICERESEVRAFKPEEYWTINVGLEAKTPPPISSHLTAVDGQKLGKDFRIQNGKEAEAIKKRIEADKVIVKSIQQRERKKNPVPPFTTSKLQQESFRKLGFNVKRTMSVAQSLYEGIEMEGEGPIGLITYMRTDSTRLSDDSVTAAREYIKDKFGEENVPDKPVQYRTKKSAQDAHEAIRPTSLELSPDAVSKHLSKDQLSLYRLIWNRFIACQMKPAIYDQMSVDFDAAGGKIQLRATGSRLIFKGFLEVYEEGQDEERKRADVEDDEAASEGLLPLLKEKEAVDLKLVDLQQHFTQPPPRFNESSLVKELDEKGIGRPSTYATILSTIVDRGYIRRVDNRYEPTVLGEKVNELLVESFPEVLDVVFTANMEENLDRVEEGVVAWKSLLKDFYQPFEKQVKVAEKEMRNVKASSEPTDIKCDRCEGVFHIKWSSRGEFLGCSNYPKCRNTREFTRDNDGNIVVNQPKYSGDACPKCGKDMIIKSGRYGDYIACVDYPTCPTVKSPQSDVRCPEEGCSGNLVPRRTRTGKTFWGCTNYPGCQYAVWDMPVNHKCESCGFTLLTKKVTKRDGTRYICPSCKITNENVDLPDDNAAAGEGGESTQATDI
jgi:DNA topoisomerase-1